MIIDLKFTETPACVFAYHVTTRERKEGIAGSDWKHFPFIELRALTVEAEQSTGKLSAMICNRAQFEPKNAVGYDTIAEAKSAAKEWVAAQVTNMIETIQEDFGNGLP